MLRRDVRRTGALRRSTDRTDRASLAQSTAGSRARLHQPTQHPPSRRTQPALAEDQNRPGEVKITPRQAEELFHSVDEILEFDSKQTGLPIKKEVKRKLTSRDEVVSFLTKHVTTKTPSACAAPNLC